MLPGCGSAWKNPTPQHLFECRAQQLLRERVAIDAGSFEPVGLGQRETLESFLDEQPARAQVAIDLRDADSRPRPEQHRHLLHCVGFVAEVDLLAQTLRELAQEVTRAHALAERRTALREVREQRKRSEIALEDFLDAGPLHLDDDGLTGTQSRAIRLPDRRGREWLPVELGKHLFDIGAEFGFEHWTHVFHRSRRDPVLQLRELATHLGREEVDAGRCDLPELDVDATGFFEDAPDAHTRSIERMVGAPPAREKRSESFTTGQAKQLAISPEHRDAPAERAHRARRNHEPGMLAQRE